MKFEIKKIDDIENCKVIYYDFFSDKRGKLWSTYTNSLFESLAVKQLNGFSHDKFSTSKKRVLRGFHGDFSTWKLVTCLQGRIQQVIFDNRVNSPTYKNSKSWIIDHNKPFSVLIPPGVLNAFCVLSEMALYHYKLAYTGHYKDFDEQISLKWNDPQINVNWLVKKPILSNRDQ